MARPSQGHRDGERIEAYYPPGDAAALEALAQVSGEDKATHLRRALSWYLNDLALAANQTTPVVANPKEHK